MAVTNHLKPQPVTREEILAGHDPEEVREQLLKDQARRVIVGGHPCICEGQLMLPHECKNGIHTNEVIFTRGQFQKLSRSEQKYFFNRINSHLCCGWFHFKHGHSRKWREYYYEHVCAMYGHEIVEWFEENAPLKIKRRK